MTPGAASAHFTREDLERLADGEAAAAAARALPDGGSTLLPLAEEVTALVLRDPLRAERLGAKLTQMADVTADGRAMACARTARAHALSAANRCEEALAVLGEAAAAAASVDAWRDLARVRLVSVQPLSMLGRPSDALLSAQAAEELFVRAGDEVGAAKARVNAGVILRRLDQPERALEQFGRARDALASSAVVLAQIDSNRAEALLDLNRFAEAEVAFRSAQEQFHAAGAGRAAAIVEGNLADLLHRQGRLEEALPLFELAIRAFERDGSSPGDLARLRAERAEAYAGVGLTLEAAADLDAALPELRERGMIYEQVRAAIARAGLHLRSGAAAAAERVLREAIAAMPREGHAVSLARSLMLMAEVVRSGGRFETAAELLGQALALVSDRPAERASAAAALGALLLECSQEDRAGPLLDDAVAGAAELGMAPLLSACLHARSRHRLVVGARDEGISDMLRAMDAVERTRARLPGERFRVAYAGERAGLYDDAVTVLLARRRPHEEALAFSVTERARCRALLDLVRGDLRGSGADAMECGGPLLEEHRAGVGELSALYSRLGDPRFAERPQEAQREWLRRVQACEGRVAALEARLAATRRYSGLFAPAADVASAAASLPAGSVLVEYVLAHGQLHAFVVGPEGLRGAEALGEVAPVRDRILRLNLQIGRALARAGSRLPRPALARDALLDLASLHVSLITPLSTLIGSSQRIIVSTVGPLHQVPFEALWDGGEYLVQRHAVSYTPSAGMLSQADRAHPVKGAGHAMVVGVADAEAPWIETEAQSVAARLKSARVLIGSEATAARVEAGASGANLLHLACHAIAPDASPLAARLKLADRWVTAREVAGWSLDGCTVVLSGCGTGHGLTVGCEELFGLVRAFFGAGAASVIATRWDVHDLTAAALVPGLYDRPPHATGDAVQGGMGAALRALQLRAIADGRHPAEWATFLSMGDIA